MCDKLFITTQDNGTGYLLIGILSKEGFRFDRDYLYAQRGHSLHIKGMVVSTELQDPLPLYYLFYHQESDNYRRKCTCRLAGVPEDSGNWELIVACVSVFERSFEIPYHESMGNIYVHSEMPRHIRRKICC